MAKRLHRASPKTGERRSLHKISAVLAAAGFLNERGKPHPADRPRCSTGIGRACVSDELAGDGRADTTSSLRMVQL